MAGNVKVGGNVIATHTGVEGAGTVTLSNVTASALKMSSSGNTITDSAGNAVLSESSGTVNISKGTVGSNVVFPAGHVLQIKRSYLKDVFEFTSTVPHNTSTGATGYTFGSAATRADNTAGQIVDALTTAITKTSATSYFLITYNLNHINNSRMSLGYTFGMCIFSSADNYVTPVDRGNANSNYTNKFNRTTFDTIFENNGEYKDELQFSANMLKKNKNKKMPFNNLFLLKNYKKYFISELLNAKRSKLSNYFNFDKIIQSVKTGKFINNEEWFILRFLSFVIFFNMHKNFEIIDDR